MAKSVKQPVETPPYLKQVRILDYAPLRDAKVDFKPGLNIIIGSNGAGKTRFLSLVRELIDLDRRHYIGAGCEIIISADKQIRISFEERHIINERADDERQRIINIPTHLLLRTSIENVISEGASIDEALWPISQQPIYLLHYLPILIRHGIPTSGLPVIDEGADWVLERKNLRVELKGGAKRLYEIESQFAQSVFRKIFSMTRGAFGSVQAESIVSVESMKATVTVVLDAYLRQLNDSLPLYSPIKAVRRNELFQVYYSSLEEEYAIKGLVLEYLLDNEWLPFGKLSDGTKRLFYIITELLSSTNLIQVSETRGDIWNGANKIIFLEEPELGIHPDQLQKLLTLIREVSDKHQVIMTTHSPQVLDMLRKDELDRITICELDPKKGTQFRKLSAATKAKAKAYMRDDSYLSDFWRFSTLERRD